MVTHDGPALLLITLGVLLAVPDDARGPSAAPGVGGVPRSFLTVCLGRGGGSISTKRVDLVYATRFDTSGVDLEAAILVRAPAKWRRLPPGNKKPDLRQQTGRPRVLAGGTVGPLWIQHESHGNTLWLDDQAVSLGAANVVLLEAGPDGPPRVVATAQVEPRLSLLDSWCHRTAPTADEVAVFHRAVWEAVRQVPAARAFLDQ